MPHRYLIAALIVTTAATSANAAMTTGIFVAKAQALRAQGMGALVSPDLPLLRSEAQAATAQLKADRDARQAAGKPPIACVPEGQSIGIMEMIDGLSALPPADKALPLKDGYARVLARKYPCG